MTGDEASVSNVSSESWAALWQALDAVQAVPVEDLAQWRGGEKKTRTDSAGVERTVIQMPYVDYAPAVLELTRTVSAVASAAGVASGPIDGPTAPDDPVGTLQWVFRVIRGDRFSEGLLASRLRDGSLVDALSRLRSWHEGSSGTS